MVKDNIKVDKLLRLKTEYKEPDFPALPPYEPALAEETRAERIQREQKGIRRTDCQKVCKQIEEKKRIVDNTTWVKK